MASSDSPGGSNSGVKRMQPASESSQGLTATQEAGQAGYSAPIAPPFRPGSSSAPGLRHGTSPAPFSPLGPWNPGTGNPPYGESQLSQMPAGGAFYRPASPGMGVDRMPAFLGMFPGPAGKPPLPWAGEALGLGLGLGGGAFGAYRGLPFVHPGMFGGMDPSQLGSEERAASPWRNLGGPGEGGSGEGRTGRPFSPWRPPGAEAGEPVGASRLRQSSPSLALTPGPFPESWRLGGAGEQRAEGAETETDRRLGKVRLADLAVEEGEAALAFLQAVDGLSRSLDRHGAAILQVGVDEAPLIRAALESARLYFRSRPAAPPQARGRWEESSGYYAEGDREVYEYRAGRAAQGPPPPVLAEVFRILGRASRAALAALVRHLRLRSDALSAMLDDAPLSPGEASSSVLATARYPPPIGSDRFPVGGAVKAEASSVEQEKGFLTLIATDAAGLQVQDPSGQWYVADQGLGPGDLLLLTGRALEHVTAGARAPSAYRVVVAPAGSTAGPSGRCHLSFRLLPRPSAVLDTSAMSAAGHSVANQFAVPVPARRFMDDLEGAEVRQFSIRDQDQKPPRTPPGPSLRSALSDPNGGAWLEDAVVAPCGHSFGEGGIVRLRENPVCPHCKAPVNLASLVPNFALRAAASAMRRETRVRSTPSLLQGRSPSMERLQGLEGPIKKRRKEERKQEGHELEPKEEQPGKEGAPSQTGRTDSSGKPRGVQYPFEVNDRVVIRGNKRTPEKFVGREAIITMQCLNGWYLVRTLDSGDNIRLQYRSLEKPPGDSSRPMQAPASSTPAPTKTPVETVLSSEPEQATHSNSAAQIVQEVRENVEASAPQQCKPSPSFEFQNLDPPAPSSSPRSPLPSYPPPQYMPPPPNNQ